MNIEQLISKINKLPATPTILPELRKLLKEPDSSIQELLTVINTDESLVSQIVRISNTPYYGSAAQNKTVNDAIMRIGFHEVYKIVAVLAASPVFNSTNELYNLSTDEQMLNSLACATLMQNFSKLSKLDSDAAYSVGLMHAIGKTVMDSGLKHQPDVIEHFKNKEITVELEREVLNYDHADAGAALLSKWKFPEEIIKPIKHQYAPAKAEEHIIMASQLAASRKIVPYMNLEPEEAMTKADICNDILQCMNIDRDDACDQIYEAQLGVEELFKMLKVKS